MNSDTVNKELGFDWAVFHIFDIFSFKSRYSLSLHASSSFFAKLFLRTLLLQEHSEPTFYSYSNFIMFVHKIYEIVKSESHFMYGLFLDQKFNCMNAERRCQKITKYVIINKQIYDIVEKVYW